MAEQTVTESEVIDLEALQPQETVQGGQALPVGSDGSSAVTVQTGEKGVALKHPGLLILINNIPVEKRSIKIRMAGDVWQPMKAFSIFIDEDPNDIPVKWTIVRDEDGLLRDVPEKAGEEPLDVPLVMAIDSHTAAIIESGVVAIMTSREIHVTMLPGIAAYTCMGCHKTLNFPPKFCTKCNFAAYCDQECAAIGWAKGHSAMCERIRAGLTHVF